MKNRVRVYRAMYNLTQEELAHHLGVTRQTIFAIEKEHLAPVGAHRDIRAGPRVSGTGCAGSSAARREGDVY